MSRSHAASSLRTNLKCTLVRLRSYACRGTLFTALASTSIGCASTTPVSQVAIRSSAPASAAPTTSLPQTVAASKPAAPDLGTLVSACQSLPTRTGIPIACQTAYDAGVLTMVAHFESQMQLLGYRDVLHKELGLPFCVAASRGGQAARVAMELHGQGRLVWDCQRGSWQAWQAVAKPNPLAPAAVCEALDRDPNMPVRCKAAAVNGTATMTVRFSSTEVARPLFASMVEDVATPFCVGSVAGGRAGFVHLRYEASKRGRSYNCETGTWGEEYSTEPARANAAPASARGAAPVAPNARALRGNDTI